MNSEFFTRILFSRNFASAKFRENKILVKGAKTLCHLLRNVNYALITNFEFRKMYFNAFRENIFLRKNFRIYSMVILWLQIFCHGISQRKYWKMAMKCYDKVTVFESKQADHDAILFR